MRWRSSVAGTIQSLNCHAAGFQTLLYWYTENDDIAIGSQAGDLSLSETGHNLTSH